MQVSRREPPAVETAEPAEGTSPFSIPGRAVGRFGVSAPPSERTSPYSIGSELRFPPFDHRASWFLGDRRRGRSVENAPPPVLWFAERSPDRGGGRPEEHRPIQFPDGRLADAVNGNRKLHTFGDVARAVLAASGLGRQPPGGTSPLSFAAGEFVGMHCTDTVDIYSIPA